MKCTIVGIKNFERFNELTFERNTEFLLAWPRIIAHVKPHLVHGSELLDKDSQPIDSITYSALEYSEEMQPESELDVRKTIDNAFADGEIYRYDDDGDGVELLVLFFSSCIKIIFYSNAEVRARVLAGILQESTWKE